MGQGYIVKSFLVVVVEVADVVEAAAILEEAVILAEGGGFGGGAGFLLAHRAAPAALHHAP